MFLNIIFSTFFIQSSPARRMFRYITPKVLNFTSSAKTSSVTWMLLTFCKLLRTYYRVKKQSNPVSKTNNCRYQCAPRKNASTQLPSQNLNQQLSSTFLSVSIILCISPFSLTNSNRFFRYARVVSLLQTSGKSNYQNSDSI